MIGQHTAAAHSAQFYVQDRFLVDAVVRYVCAALGRREAVIVIATAEHRQSIADRLRARGNDVTRAHASGGYSELDAHELLATITAEGQLDTARLSAIVGDVITRARTANRDEKRPIALFGEMVSLLCARGEPQVALELEQYWNGLTQDIPMKLFCGYAAGSFDRAAHAEVFQKICAEHTHVLPEESYLELETDADRLRYVAEAQQKARALETELAARRQSEDALIRSEKLAVMGRLTASIAHEINNPLASLTNLFYLINTDTSLDPAARHYAELADQELRRTARITKQMLGFYRESTKPVPCLLAPIMDGVLELYEPRLRTCSIIVEKEYTTDGAVAGFPAEMRQLFANLIGNAIEAVGKAGKIRLRIASGRDWADPARLGGGSAAVSCRNTKDASASAAVFTAVSRAGQSSPCFCLLLRSRPMCRKFQQQHRIWMR
jgi:signal transduction histidine kinase